MPTDRRMAARRRSEGDGKAGAHRSWSARVLALTTATALALAPAGCGQQRPTAVGETPQVAVGLRVTDPMLKDVVVACDRRCKRGVARGSDRHLLCLKDCPGYVARSGRCEEHPSWLSCYDRVDVELDGPRYGLMVAILGGVLVVGLIALCVWAGCGADDDQDDDSFPPQ